MDERYYIKKQEIMSYSLKVNFYLKIMESYDIFFKFIKDNIEENLLKYDFDCSGSSKSLYSMPEKL